MLFKNIKNDNKLKSLGVCIGLVYNINDTIDLSDEDFDLVKSDLFTSQFIAVRDTEANNFIAIDPASELFDDYNYVDVSECCIIPKPINSRRIDDIDIDHIFELYENYNNQKAYVKIKKKR